MAYSDFTLQMAVSRFSLIPRRVPLFPELIPLEPSDQLQQRLQDGMALAVLSEKSRSEFIVVPILLEIRRLTDNRIAIYSGERFDVEPSVGLSGECDFLISLSEPLPIIQSPVISIIEAKKQDIELGLGQCAAQMVGSARFNERAGNSIHTVYGCVTTGETWQFLRLTDNLLELDSDRHYINELGSILRILLEIVAMASADFNASTASAASSLAIG